MPAGNEQTDDDFWDTLGDDALDPIQVPMLEALSRIGEPLSAIGMVDVLDGYLSMWEAKDRLEALRKAGVVEPASADESREPLGKFYLPYRLSIAVIDALD
jgi:hypothetical protein